MRPPPSFGQYPAAVAFGKIEVFNSHFAAVDAAGAFVSHITRHGYWWRRLEADSTRKPTTFADVLLGTGDPARSKNRRMDVCASDDDGGCRFTVGPSIFLRPGEDLFGLSWPGFRQITRRW